MIAISRLWANTCWISAGYQAKQNWLQPPARPRFSLARYNVLYSCKSMRGRFAPFSKKKEVQLDMELAWNTQNKMSDVKGKGNGTEQPKFQNPDIDLERTRLNFDFVDDDKNTLSSC